MTHDRFLYLPLLGLSGLVARGLDALLGGRSAVRVPALVVSVLLPAGQAGATFVERAHYLSDLHFWGAELRTHPTFTHVVNNTHATLLRLGRPQDAFGVAVGNLAMRRGQLSPSEELHLHVLAARASLRIVRDIDQGSLMELSAFHGDLLAKRPLRLHLGELRYQHAFTPDMLPWLRWEEEQLRADWSQLLLRTNRPRRAADVLEPMCAAPAGGEHCVSLALAYARSHRWTDARATLERPGARGQPRADRLREHLVRIQAMADQPASTPAQRALRGAEVQLSLGSVQGARVLLAPALAELAGHPALVGLATRVEMMDGQPRRVLELLQRAIAAAPDEASFQTQLHELLAAHPELTPAASQSTAP